TTLTFNADIYGYNQVYNDNDGDNAEGNVEGGGARGGSNIDATGGLTLNSVAWTEAPITPAGVTNLSYTTAPITSLTTIKLYIKENTQSAPQPAPGPFYGPEVTCGVSTITGSGAAAECFIEKTIVVRVAQSITAVSYTCVNGLVTVTTTPASGFGSYNLFLDNSADNALDRNFNVTASPFTFQLTQGDAPDYTLSITGSQSPNCSPLPAITGGALCVFTPVCPVFADNASCPANSSTPCPGSNLSFGLSTTLSTNLPNGGTVEWVNDKDNDGDVYDEAASAVIATQSISTSHAPQACGDLSAGEIAFVNISTSSSTEQFCFVNLVPLAAGTQIKFIDASWSSTASSFNSSEGGLITWTAPAATVPIGSIVCISNSTGTVSIVSGVGTVAHSSWGTGSFALNNNGDQIFAFCGTSPTSTGAIPSGMTLLAGINADADSWAYKSDQPSESSDLPPGLINGQSAIAIGDGPPSPSSSVGDVNVGNFNCTGGTLSGSMSALSMAINTVGNWTVTPDAGTAATPSACTITNTVVPNVPPPIVTLTPACATYTVPVEACNTTLRIKPRISPDQTGCAPGTPTPTLPTETFVVTCPTATISGE
ncbi:MAG TPA: hypothetical protein PK858_05885, partial [Saprospiraceae bacterium]|nr:hypothetical protein [Saprospiraceae bacterium]